MKIQDESGDKVRRLAWLPIIFMTEQEDVFERYGQEEDIEEAYRDVMTSSLWVYLLHIYHGLVRSRFGSDTEDRVREVQRDIFNSEESASGDAIIAALELVECALRVDIDGDPDWNICFEMPAELAVALALLVGLPDSPDYRSRKAKPSDYAVHRMPGVDWRLARVLGRGRQVLLDSIEPVIDRLAYVPHLALVQ